MEKVSMEKVSMEKVSMEKVSMETVVDDKILADYERVYGTFEFKGKTYVPTDDAYLDNNSEGYAAYFANAVMLGAEIDKEFHIVSGSRIEWKITNENAEESCDACDWDKDIVNVQDDISDIYRLIFAIVRTNSIKLVL